MTDGTGHNAATSTPQPDEAPPAPPPGWTDPGQVQAKHEQRLDRLVALAADARAELARRGMLQKDLAKAAGVREAQVSGFLRSPVYMDNSAEVVVAILAALFDGASPAERVAWRETLNDAYAPRSLLRAADVGRFDAFWPKAGAHPNRYWEQLRCHKVAPFAGKRTARVPREPDGPAAPGPASGGTAGGDLPLTGDVLSADLPATDLPSQALPGDAAADGLGGPAPDDVDVTDEVRLAPLARRRHRDLRTRLVGAGVAGVAVAAVAVVAVGGLAGRGRTGGARRPAAAAPPAFGSHCSAAPTPGDARYAALPNPGSYLPGWAPVAFDLSPVCNTGDAIAQTDKNCYLDRADATIYENVLLNLSTSTPDQVIAAGELIGDDGSRAGASEDAQLQGPAKLRSDLGTAADEWTKGSQAIVSAGELLRQGTASASSTAMSDLLSADGELSAASALMVADGAPNCALDS